MTVIAPEDQKLRPKSGRKPLQPINSLATPHVNRKTTPKPIVKQECADKNQNQNQNQISSAGAGDLNKENQTYPVANVESLDASLADELNAIRKKLERLRLDKERTEKMLGERGMILDVQMKEIQHRGEIQKMLEIEVDRLYRLKELKSYCMRASSIRSLREKEQEKKISEAPAANSQELMNAAAASDKEESVGENFMQSPSSSTFSEFVVTQKEK